MNADKQIKESYNKMKRKSLRGNVKVSFFDRIIFGKRRDKSDFLYFPNCRNDGIMRNVQLMMY